MGEEVVEDFRSSLGDLTQNCKPLISMLTMLADDNHKHSEQIVKVIETHLHKTAPQQKLPCLYLIDSIIKNVQKKNEEGLTYVEIFSKNIVFCFLATFEKVDEKIRQSLYKLRQTWIDLFPNKILYMIDIGVKRMDPAWPITAQPETVSSNSIYVNPKFLMKQDSLDSNSSLPRATVKQPNKVDSVDKKKEKKPLNVSERSSPSLSSNQIKKTSVTVPAASKAVASNNAKKESLVIVKKTDRVGVGSKDLEREKSVMQELLLEKHRKEQELLLLQRQVLENELAQAKAQLEQQTKLLQQKQRQVRISAAIAPSSRQISAVTEAPVSTGKSGSTVQAPVVTATIAANRDPRLKSKDVSSSSGPSVVSSSSGHQTAVILPTYNKTPTVSATTSINSDLTNSRSDSLNIWERMSDLNTPDASSSGSSLSPSPSQASVRNSSSASSTETPSHNSPARQPSVVLPAWNDEQRPVSRGKVKPGAKPVRSPSFTGVGGAKSAAQAMAKGSLTRAVEYERAAAAAAAASPGEAGRRGGAAGRGTRDRLNFKIPKVKGRGSETSEPNHRGGGRPLLRTPPPSADGSVPPLKRPRIGVARGGVNMSRDPMRDRFNPEPENFDMVPERFIPPTRPMRRDHSAPLLELPSPSRTGSGWAQFKADHPEDFPYESQEAFQQSHDSPGLLSRPRGLLPTPPVGPGPSKHPEFSSSVPPASPAESELQDQMARLQKMRAELEMKKRELHEQSMKLSAFNEAENFGPDRGNNFSRGQQYSRNGRLLPPGVLLPTPGNHDGELGPHRPRLSVGPMQPVQTGPEYWLAPATPWYDKERFYVPEHDPRWCLRVASLRNCDSGNSSPGDSDAYTVGIDGRQYEMFLGGKPRRMKLGAGAQIDVRLDRPSRKLLMDEIPVYQLGEDLRFTPPLKDGRVHEVVVRGPTRKLWIDKRQFDVSVDAPAERININGREHTIKIDGARDFVIVDGFDICRFGTREVQHITLAFVVHTMEFVAPLKQILIDGAARDLDLSGQYPNVIIDGIRRGIRFDGGEREIVIDDIPYRVPMDRALKWRQDASAGGAVGKPRLLAFGGPGHEVVIDDQWHEIKFGGEVKFIRIGALTHKVQLRGGAPEVKILGQMVSEVELDRIMRKESGAHRNDGGMATVALSGGDAMHRAEWEAGHRPVGIQGDFRQGLRPPQQPMQQPGVFERPQAPQFIPNRPPVPPQRPHMLPPHVSNLPHLQQVAPVQQPQQYQSPSKPQTVLPQQQNTQQPAAAADHPSTSTGAAATGSVDVGSLLQQLMAAGLLPAAAANTDKSAAIKSETAEVPTESMDDKSGEPSTSGASKSKPVISSEVDEPSFPSIPDLTSFNISLLKVKYPGAIESLRAGKLQCSTCGLRYMSTESGSAAYREHLDGHFREKKKMKELERTGGQFRVWYHDMVDWIEYEEFGAVMGEPQQQQQQDAEHMDITDTANLTTTSTALDEDPDIDTRPSASEDDDEDVCAQCGEAFDQYFDEDAEEWRLKDAIRYLVVSPPKAYHRVCFEDVKRREFLAREAADIYDDDSDNDDNKVDDDNDKIDDDNDQNYNVNNNQDRNDDEADVDNGDTDSIVTKLEPNDNLLIKTEPADSLIDERSRHSSTAQDSAAEIKQEVIEQSSSVIIKTETESDTEESSTDVPETSEQKSPAVSHGDSISDEGEGEGMEVGESSGCGETGQHGDEGGDGDQHGDGDEKEDKCGDETVEKEDGKGNKSDAEEMEKTESSDVMSEIDLG